MARFRGTAGSASRLGHATSGLETTCRGWNAGVDVYASADGDDDLFGIYANEGNGYNPGRRLRIGTVKNTADGPVFVPSRQVEEAILAAHGVAPMPDVEAEVHALA